MGQVHIKENIFRTGIIEGFSNHGIKISKDRPYPGKLNYALIIKPLYLDMNFRLPIMMYFSGLPYHVGILCSTDYDNIVYSFCPDLQEPHRGTLIKDIKQEGLNSWLKESELCEIFWILNEYNESEDIDMYTQITARLIDLLNVKYQLLDLNTFNKRYGTNLQMYYNLFTNNCTTMALTVLTGKSICYQIECIKPIIKELLCNPGVINMLPKFAVLWLNDYKSIN
jgi:hypothetical protein